MSAPDRGIPVVAVLGPTASGKSGLALRLAELLGGEIVSADSAQVYRGADLGTAKPTPEERARVPHHLVDVRSLEEDFSLADFQALAGEALRDIHARGRLPFLVGGTGLYVRGLLEGYTLGEHPPDPELRRALQAREVEDLVRQLRELDPVSAERIDPRNRRRVERALEVCLQTGRPFSEGSRTRPSGYRSLKLALHVERPALVERIALRLERMVQAGWVEEVRALAEKGHAPSLRRLRILGYPELLEVVEGARPLAEALEAIRVATRRYARRQVTWLRAEPAVQWIAGPDEEDAARRIRAFLADARGTEDR